MVDMTYMPGYFIEQYPHKHYTNRFGSWSPGNRPVALPPGLTKAGAEEKLELTEYIKKRSQQSQNNKTTKQLPRIGDKKILIKPPSLRLAKGQYKRPQVMFDLDHEDMQKCDPNTFSKTATNYTIFPSLAEMKRTPYVYKSQDWCSGPQKRGITAGKVEYG